MQSACAVLYCYLRYVRHYNISAHYVIKDTIFGGKIGLAEHKMCVLIFPINPVENISRSEKNLK